VLVVRHLYQEDTALGTEIRHTTTAAELVVQALEDLRCDGRELKMVATAVVGVDALEKAPEFGRKFRGAALVVCC